MILEYKKLNSLDMGVCEDVVCFDVTKGKLTFRQECCPDVEVVLTLAECEEVEVYGECYGKKQEYFEYEAMNSYTS